MGGLVLETSLGEITMHAEAQAKNEKTEVSRVECVHGRVDITCVSRSNHRHLPTPLPARWTQ